MEDKVLIVLDSKVNLILKAHMSKNRTFKIVFNVIEHRCLVTTTCIEEYIWHNKLGYLNFRNLKSMKRNDMVSGLPEIPIPSESCKECP